MPRPLDIEIGLHYHCSPTDYCVDGPPAPAVQEALDMLVDAGLLEHRELCQRGSKEPAYVATEGLKIWVNRLQDVPFPRQVWMAGDSQWAKDMDVHSPGRKPTEPWEEQHDVV